MLIGQPHTVWTRTFGGEGINEAGDYVLQTNDGGYVILGQITASQPYDGVWLIKTDSNGDEEWNRTFFDGNAYHQGHSVYQTNDGGFIIAGAGILAESWDGWLIKTDSDGFIEWDTTFGGSDEDRFTSVQQTDDGGYIITGMSVNLSGNSDCWLVKADADGNEQWARYFDFGLIDWGHDVQQTSDGGYIIFGEAQNSENIDEHADFLLIKTDSNGNEQWNKTLGSSELTEAGRSGQQTSDGGYIIVGRIELDIDNQDTDVLLIKTDSEGNEQWSQNFSGTGEQHGSCVQQTTDGGYIISGISWHSNFGPTHLIIKTDWDGNEDWRWNQNFGMAWADGFIQQTTDGGYIFTAGIDDEGSDVLLIRFVEEPDGSGTGGDPYQISSLADLQWVSENSSSWDKYFIQTSDIDASETFTWEGGAGFAPIANADTQFDGYYDGQDFNIIGLYINSTSGSSVGLFGSLGQAVLENINLIDATINAPDNFAAGVLFGSQFGFGTATIENCSVSGVVNGLENVGGLGGWFEKGDIIRCKSDCEITAYSAAGGLVASFGYLNPCNISDSYARGTLLVTAGIGGGLIGDADENGSINNSYSTSVVNATDPGGLVGINNGTSVNNSFWDIETSDQSSSQGGTGLTTLEMKTLSTFIEAGWDFELETYNGTDDYWDMDLSGSMNDGYPFLSWENGDGEVNVTFRVDAQYEDVGSGVYFAGSMNIWSPTDSPMSDTDGDGVWEITFPLISGVTYEYKFVLNGDGWENDLPEDCTIPGGGNRTITVDAIDMILDPVCYGDCAPCASPIVPTEIFFSEYVEGSSNNKALEIYNASGLNVDLSNYRIAWSSNGQGWQYYHTFTIGTFIGDGDVWVITTDDADASIQAVADEILSYPSVVYHNGNDARGLISISGTDTTWIDIIGDPNNNPGLGWDVAGVVEATQNHTLVRKASVTEGNGGDWASSAGTNENNSEWIVYDQDSWDNLGWHNSYGSNLPVKDGLSDDIDWTNITNQLSANWLSNLVDGAVSFEYAIGIYSTPSTEVVTWTSTGTDTFFTHTGLSLAEGATYYSHIRGLNGSSQPIDTASSDGVTIDASPPVSGTIIEGDTNDIDYTSNAETLQLTWTGFSDDNSGLSHYQYGLGTTQGADDMVSFTETTETSVVLEAELIDGTTYFGVVRAYDVAGNVSEIVSGDGVMLDISAPEAGTVVDGLDQDNDYINSISNVDASWSGFSDAGSGIASYEYALGSDSSLVDVIGFISAGSDQSIMLSELALTHGDHYQFSVRAIDMVGNVSDTSTSNGFMVDEFAGPPQITSMSIDTLSIVNSTTDTQIEIEFSEPLQSHHVELGANIQSGYAVASVYSEDPPKLSLTLQAPFASLDTLTLTVNNVVDLAGVQAEEQSFTYYSNILADYNSDQIIDIIDLVQFIQAWTNNDITLELGPVTGTVPHLIPALDNLFTVRDAMTFSRMWYWSNTSATNTIAVRSGVGAPIEINQSGRQITITLPDGSIASEIAIEYPLEHMEFSYQSKSSQENEIVASKKFGEELVFIQLNGFVTSEDAAVEKEIMFDINGSPEHEIDLVIHYRFIGSGSETIGSGSYRLNYLPMPDEFSLYQNYPNPFNPVTQIKYDLPEASHVQLFIYDILGREVTALVNEVQEPGYRSITWHGTDAFGRNVGVGMYFYSIQAGDFRQTKKMVLLK